MPKEEKRRKSREMTHKMLKRKKKKVNLGLTRQDIEYLQKNTRFDEQEIVEWYRLVNIYYGVMNKRSWNGTG